MKKDGCAFICCPLDHTPLVVKETTALGGVILFHQGRKDDSIYSRLAACVSFLRGPIPLSTWYNQSSKSSLWVPALLPRAYPITMMCGNHRLAISCIVLMGDIIDWAPHYWILIDELSAGRCKALSNGQLLACSWSFLFGEQYQEFKISALALLRALARSTPQTQLSHNSPRRSSLTAQVPKLLCWFLPCSMSYLLALAFGHGLRMQGWLVRFINVSLCLHDHVHTTRAAKSLGSPRCFFVHIPSPSTTTTT